MKNTNQKRKKKKTFLTMYFGQNKAICAKIRPILLFKKNLKNLKKKKMGYNK